MPNPLRAGLVGCGSLSQRGVLPHLSLPDAQEKVRLVAVADAVAERARLSAEKFGIGAHFTSLEEMLADVDLDLVLVITPIQYHYANALAAIEAGKHVYVQKTMTTTLAEADELLAARDRRGVKLAAAPGFELFPTTAAMRQLVQDGALGRVCVGFTYTLGFGHEFETIRAGQGALAAIDPAWYYRPGAGPLPDVTVYSLQLATSVLGPVRRVAALSNRTRPERVWQGQTLPVQVNDNNLLMLEFESGAIVTAVGANCRGSRRIPWGALSLYGTEGVLEVTEVNHASGYPLIIEWQRNSPETIQFELSAQPYLQGAHLTIEEPHVYADIMDLADAILANRPPRATGEQARHVVEIIEKAHAAAQGGQTQTLQSSFTLDG
jgi:predicted dehydrogenase